MNGSNEADPNDARQISCRETIIHLGEGALPPPLL